MRVVHVSTYDSGGAGRAAYQLHSALKASGQESAMLVLHRTLTDDSVIEMVGTTEGDHAEPEVVHSLAIQRHYIDLNRTHFSTTVFSGPFPGYDLSRLPLVQMADIVNLHWVAGFQSLSTLSNLLELGIPVVWTLHDQWPLTGGCHFSAGCLKFMEDCRACPQLAVDPYRLTSNVLLERKALYQRSGIAAVAPSNWMSECAEASLPFADSTVTRIPYAVNTSVFRPGLMTKMRNELGVPENSFVMLFVAQNMSDARKGFSDLIQAIQYLHNESEKPSEIGHMLLLCVGSSPEVAQDLGLPVVSLGYQGDDEALRRAYVAADVFVLPTKEDNLPNTLLEAISCGTPVVAYATGGVPDVVEENVTGKLAPTGDYVALSTALMEFMRKPSLQAEMRVRCRQIALERYSPSVQARRYQALYEELITTPADRVASSSPKSDRLSEETSSIRQEYRFAPVLPNGQPFSKETYNALLCESLKLFSISEFEARRNLERAIDRDKREHLRQTIEFDRIKRREQMMRQSVSWRLTRPLRSIPSLLRGWRRRQPN